jgi:hypothetical protein
MAISTRKQHKKNLYKQVLKRNECRPPKILWSYKLEEAELRQDIRKLQGYLIGGEEARGPNGGRGDEEKDEEEEK